MKRIGTLLAAVLLMVLIPMKSIGQTPYRQYADEGIMLNFFTISEYPG